MANLINILFDHEGGRYDIQAEDLGAEKALLDLRIYKEGAIVFQKQIDYRGQVASELDPREHALQVRGLMTRHIETLKKGIAAGKVK